MEKLCRTCKKIKNVSEFSKKKSSVDGYSHKCKQCHNEYSKNVWYPKNKERHIQSQRNYKLKNRIKIKAKYYNISEELLRLSFENSNGVCQICSENKPLCIDHDHKTNEVRGLICEDCNKALGFFKDDFEVIEKAISYLKK